MDCGNLAGISGISPGIFSHWNWSHGAPIRRFPAPFPLFSRLLIGQILSSAVDLPEKIPIPAHTY